MSKLAIASSRVAVLAVAAFALFCAVASVAFAGGRSVFINGVRLPDRAVSQLEAAYRTRVADGRYWYDVQSGLWGFEGGRAAGQIHAGLPMGGRLQPQASNGDTYVFVNGRRLPRYELWLLQQTVGNVAPGRYWLDAWGNAGFEGGPALVNVFAAARNQSSGGGYGGWNRNTSFGNWGGDGECSYYNHPNGSSVMTGNC